MSHSCVCGGANENCRYCGGSGTIPDRLGSALDETLRRVGIENAPTDDIRLAPKRRSSLSRAKVLTRVKWVRCPKGCGRWVNILDTLKFARHLGKCTGVRVAPPKVAASTPSSVPKPEEINLQSCPFCGAKLKPGRIQRHMSNAHGTSTSNPLFAEFARKAQRARQRTTGATSVQQNAASLRRERTDCPVCKAAVNVGRLKKHMAKVHKQRLAPRPMQPASAKDPTRENTTLVAPRDKNLDATKLYAHRYREQGRYGSHPAHDGFDDESTPD